MKKRKFLHLLYSFFVSVVLFYVLILVFRGMNSLQIKESNIFDSLIDQAVNKWGDIGIAILLLLSALLCFALWFGVMRLMCISEAREDTTGFPFKVTRKYYRICHCRNSIEIELLRSPYDDYYKLDFLGKIENERAKNIISMALCEAIYKFRNLRHYKCGNLDGTLSYYSDCNNLIIYSVKTLSLRNVNCSAINYCCFEKIDLSNLLLKIDNYYDDYYSLYENFANHCKKLFLPKTDKRRYAFVTNEIRQCIECYPLSYILGRTYSVKGYGQITYFKIDGYDHVQISEDEYYYIKKIILQKLDYSQQLKFLEEYPFKQTKSNTEKNKNENEEEI